MKMLLLLSLFVSTSVSAEIKNTGDEDVLSNVESKLLQIEERLKDNRVSISSAVFNWSELHDFKEALIFAVAHDPTGPVAKDTPEELSPSNLTIKLKFLFTRLETSVYQVGTLIKSEEWAQFKADVQEFFKYRDEFLYVSARTMIKSGNLMLRFDRLKEAAAIILKVNDKSKNISIRVIDPVIEELSGELNHMNIAIRQLQEFRKPRPVEVKTIFQEKNKVELGILGAVAILTGILGTCLIQWVASKVKKKTPVQAAATTSFDYFNWLTRLESNLKSFRDHEHRMTEDHIKLKNYSQSLSDYRKKLNLADNQQDFYESLEQLNATAVQIEGYFEKLNLKKNSEVSKRVVGQMIQLCDALESNQEIVITDQTKMRASKIDPEVVELRVA